MTVDREIDLLDWHNLLEVNVSLAKVLRVPNLVVGWLYMVSFMTTLFSTMLSLNIKLKIFRASLIIIAATFIDFVLSDIQDFYNKNWIKLKCFWMKQAVPDAATICLRPLQVDNIFVFIRQVAVVPAYWLFKTPATSWSLTLKVVSESRVTWATSVPILVFLGLSVT